MPQQTEDLDTRADRLLEFLDLSERRRGDEAAYFRSVEECDGLGGLGQPFVNRLHVRALASRKRVLAREPGARLSDFPAYPKRLWREGFLRTLFLVLVTAMCAHIQAAWETAILPLLFPGLVFHSEANRATEEPEACEHLLWTRFLSEAVFDLFLFFVLARVFRGRAQDFLALRLGLLLSPTTYEVECFGLAPGTAAMATEIAASFALWAVLYGLWRLRPSTRGGDWALRLNA